MRIAVDLPLFFLLALSCLLRGALGQSSFDENGLVIAALGQGAKAPIFNAYFPTNPATIVGATLNYTWSQIDPTDSAATAATHQGVVSLSGAPNSYIDVGTATGANSCGQVLPMIGGPGSGTGATQGWSVDMVVKLTASGGWAKLIDFGDGPFATGSSTINDLTITWDGNENNENGAMEGLAVQQLSSPPPATYYNFAVVPILKPVIGQWYHIALVMQAVNVSAASSTWFVYVNGQLLPYSDSLQSGTSLTAFQGANLPLPVARPQSYIGKSDYGDPTLQGVFDAVRVYDYALTAAQVKAVAAVYNLNTGLALPTPANDKNVATTAETNYWQNAGISRAPIVNAVFPENPASVIGATPYYQWAAADSSDNAAVAALHKGVVQLTGTVNSFVDLNTPTGANSIGLVMGTFGGGSQGWSVEMVVKPTAATPYTKLLTIGNGGYLDVLFIGWDVNGQAMYVEQTSNVNVNLPGVIGQTDLTINTTIALNQWVHIAVVMQPTNMAVYAGSMAIYVNGQLILSSADPKLINYPVPTYRDQTYIGASDYQDANAQAVYDAVRIYDQALSQRQVQLMAQQYGLFNGSLAAGDDSGGSSGLSGGKIAGAVIGSVVGAILLCALLAFIMTRSRGSSGSSGSGKSVESPKQAKGATYGDVSESSSTEMA